MISSGFVFLCEVLSPWVVKALLLSLVLII